MLIVYLYVNDLIFIGNNLIMFGQFKEVMPLEVLCYTILAQKRDKPKMINIFFSQEGYAKEILRKFSIYEYV